MTTATDDPDLKLMVATLIREVRSLRSDVNALSTKQSEPSSEVWAIGARKLALAFKGNLNVSADRIRELVKGNFFTPNECVMLGTPKQNRYKFHVENCRIAIKWFDSLSPEEQQKVLNARQL